VHPLVTPIKGLLTERHVLQSVIARELHTTRIQVRAIMVGICLYVMRAITAIRAIGLSGLSGLLAMSNERM